jgi:hypothetical protein
VSLVEQGPVHLSGPPEITIGIISGTGTAPSFWTA